jgi:glycosyltransferase involved in cell wall biosynthesis
MIPAENAFYVPHGVKVQEFPFSEGSHDNILWFGRIDPRIPKGAKEALQVSNFVGRDIVMNSSVVEDEDYFEKTIKPLFSEHTHFSKDRSREELFSDAKLFLFPVQKEELFGMTMIEAMAAGIPVVAFARNAAAEVIVDGETGFLVNPSEEETNGNWIVEKNGIEGLSEAVEKVYSLSSEEYQEMRRKCRVHIEENFSIEKMIDGYEEVYKKVIEDFEKS